MKGIAPLVTCGNTPFHFSKALNSKTSGLLLKALLSIVKASALPFASATFCSASN